MGRYGHHTSSLREAFSACLLGLGVAVISLCFAADQMKTSEGGWAAACSGKPRNPTAGRFLAASAALVLFAMVLGVYHGARGVWTVLRGLRHFPTCCSGSWSTFRQKLRTKPFLWQLAVSFFVALCTGARASDILIAGAANELQGVSAGKCSGSSLSVTQGSVGGGVLGMVCCVASALLFLFTDVKERRKQKARQYLSSSFYNDGAIQSDDEADEDEVELEEKLVIEHTARAVTHQSPDKRLLAAA